MEIKTIDITRKHTIYNVVSSRGLLCATFQNKDAAIKFIELIHKHNITTIEQWRKLPPPVRVAFISATCMVEPFL